MVRVPFSFVKHLGLLLKSSRYLPIRFPRRTQGSAMTLVITIWGHMQLQAGGLPHPLIRRLLLMSISTVHQRKSCT